MVFCCWLLVTVALTVFMLGNDASKRIANMIFGVFFRSVIMIFGVYGVR